jgi:hypothetical protein
LTDESVIVLIVNHAAALAHKVSTSHYNKPALREAWVRVVANLPTRKAHSNSSGGMPPSSYAILQPLPSHPAVIRLA